MEEVNEMQQVDDAKRPKLLTVIGILTFVSLGFQFLSLLINLIRGKQDEDGITEDIAQTLTFLKKFGTDEDSLELTKMAMEQTNDSFWLVQFIAILSIGLGLSGVIMMFKRRKIGFHLYIIYSLLGVGGGYLYLSSDLTTMMTLFGSISVAILFIVLYGLNLKWLK